MVLHLCLIFGTHNHQRHGVSRSPDPTRHVTYRRFTPVPSFCGVSIATGSPNKQLSCGTSTAPAAGIADNTLFNQGRLASRSACDTST
ncbi:Piso0_004380 [Millerozyma farinosa CBS 7064]|uniref:Piso0_004380 protein n=1 Tax=Pichia sorbitophila (strain ATCC MYA-4447 / BCRC 22081 / CBS 7064 / NBRC 10061 / NRRL Y-12695) TaxID=559304 RepID=G8Y5B2_PICSO|nr:Piso0_004380 [Millerozyma farinosa CBS 7064]CCE84823.1 Piso0_004380 [Millerozyma farinosa CBS 7064]